MNRNEIIEIFTEALKKKYVGTKHNNHREIVDVKVTIEEEYIDYGGESTYDYGDNGKCVDDIKIEVKTKFPKGKNCRWEKVYL
jgi:hypothetical protein